MNIAEMNRHRYLPYVRYAARAMNRQRGLTLVELMVAMLISSFILIGLVQIFATNRITYQADEGLARLQENGRFAIDFLVRDIRMAGNMGCLGKIPPDDQNNVWNYLDTTSPAYNLSTGINGFEATGTAPGATFAMPSMYPSPTNVYATTPALDPLLVPGAIQGTDVLAVRFMDGEAVSLVPNAGGKYHDSAQVFAGTPNTLAQGDIVMVTNCKQVAIFQITNNPTGGSPMNIAHGNGGSPGNTCPVWGTGSCKGYDNAFQAGSQIAVLRSRFFFIGRQTRGTSANLGPSLFRRDANVGQPTELVEGIENMQILYGVDNNIQNDTGKDGHGADSYLRADQVTNWSRVVSVRIGLLVSTSNTTEQTVNVGQSADDTNDTSTYTVAGVTLDPVDDRRRRRVFTTTIGLRNL